MYVAEVRVELKPGVADPEGANTKKALELLGFKGVKNVKSVHAFSIELDAASKSDAERAVSDMCKRLLVNPVIHVPRIILTNGAGGEAVGRSGATAGRSTGGNTARIASKGRGQKVVATKSAKAKGAKPAATKAKAKKGGKKR